MQRSKSSFKILSIRRLGIYFLQFCSSEKLIAKNQTPKLLDFKSILKFFFQKYLFFSQILK